MSSRQVSSHETPAASSRARTAAKLAALAGVTSAAVFYRRPDQFRHPYVWVEDGLFNIPQYAEHGWGILLQPIVGYVSLPIRTIFALSSWLSFRWLPEISVALTLVFVYGVLVAIALSPTHLRLRFWCAVMVVLVPSNSEVFGVSLYTGWWGSLLAFIPLFWRDTPKVAARSLLLLVGGLSTPAVVGLVPLYACRLYLFRRRSELWMLSLCLILAALQAGVLLQNPAPLRGVASWASLASVIEKFFGHYAFWTALMPTSRLYLVLGLAVCATLAVSLYVRRPVSWPIAGLVACLLLTIALSIGRERADVIHPLLAGPRYFFLPNVMLSWLLLNLLDRRYQGTTVFCLAALLLSVRMAVVHGQRAHLAIDWRAEVNACLLEETHTFPIHFEGYVTQKIMWSVTLTQQVCTRLVRDSVFDNDPGRREP